jgi:SAM-dependent methyltransferase
MKLSQLVAYRNTVAEMAAAVDLGTVCVDPLNRVQSVVNATAVPAVAQHSSELAVIAAAVSHQVQQFETVLRQLTLTLNQQIDHMAADQFESDPGRHLHHNADFVFQWPLHRSAAFEQMITDRVQLLTAWTSAGLIIRPAHYSWTQWLVSKDPLYLVDQTADLLEPMLRQHNDAYRRRLRPYVVNESSGAILHQLPQGQFGTVVAVGFFEFRPMALIQQYLAEIWQLLHPGGVLCMTINDCDYQHAVRLAEQNFCTYTPGSQVQSLAQDLGYTLRFSRHDQGSAQTWLEFERPGSRVSLKGGQTLAQIVPVSVAQSK